MNHHSGVVGATGAKAGNAFTNSLYEDALLPGTGSNVVEATDPEMDAKLPAAEDGARIENGIDTVPRGK